MSELENARIEIDAIDRQMQTLFCARMDAVQKVVAYKMKHNLPVLDASREDALLQKNLSYLEEDTYRQYYIDFLQYNMNLSRQMQSKILGQNTVAYQGVEGAFSHIALKKLFPHADTASYATFAQVFDAVQNDVASYGVLPFENSHAGDVSEVLDLCFAHEDLSVWEMYDLPVGQNLLGVAGATLSDIKTVVSHPQGLAQTAQFTQKLNLDTKSFPNTAAAAKHVAETGDKTIAAIAAKETAELYGLCVLAENINTSENNTTRFIVIGKQKKQAGNRFSLLFTVNHQAGQLARVMQIIGEMGFNMECIKSRPMPHVSWEYYFYSELEGDVCAQSSKELLERLETICRTIRVLGVYDKKAK